MATLINKKNGIAVSGVAIASNVSLDTLTCVSATSGYTGTYYNSTSVVDDKPKEIKEEPRKESLEEIISYFGVR